MGTITGSGFTLTLNGAGTGTLASIIGTVTGGVTMNGAGSWTLSGNNTYTGATTVNAGALTLTGANDKSGSLFLNGGSLVLNTGCIFLGQPERDFRRRQSDHGHRDLWRPQSGGGHQQLPDRQCQFHADPRSGRMDAGRGFRSEREPPGHQQRRYCRGCPHWHRRARGTNKIFGGMLVTDSNGVTGLGQLNGTTLQRFDSTTASPSHLHQQ